MKFQYKLVGNAYENILKPNFNFCKSNLLKQLTAMTKTAITLLNTNVYTLFAGKKISISIDYIY